MRMRACLAALVLLAVGVASASADGVKQVPISSSGSWAPVVSEGTIDCTGGPPLAIPHVLAGSGRDTHLGNTSFVITIESCAFGAEGLVSSGHDVVTAANGDQLFKNWTDVANPLTGAIVWPQVTFTGGTGRFADATGSMTGTGWIDPATGVGGFSLSGMISSIGSRG